VLDPILNAEQKELLESERSLLAEVTAGLERGETPAEDLSALADSVGQLDELFLLVVVGEFNAGKSALINALLGCDVLAEGVTPTTSKIHHIGWGDELSREPMGPVGERITAPVETLRQLTIVDTPGTNALDRTHEALTTDYVPRADLVLFVTSSDRPLSESERVFLETIRQWGKKVAMVVNKIDILRSEDEVAEVVTYVSQNASRLLGVDPEVFPVSAIRAAEAEDEAARSASGLPAVETFLRDTLDSGELLCLKLGNPLGVASHLLTGTLEKVNGRLDLLGDDLRTIDDIERQTGTWTEDVRREFDLRLSDIDNALYGMEQRGTEFFDTTVRLNRLPKLFDKSELKARFESEVVAGAPESVEAKVDSLIDWLVDSELAHWQNVVNHVNRRVGRPRLLRPSWRSSANGGRPAEGGDVDRGPRSRGGRSRRGGGVGRELDGGGHYGADRGGSDGCARSLCSAPPAAPRQSGAQGKDRYPAPGTDVQPHDPFRS
jgi:small GTP-binding protein